MPLFDQHGRMVEHGTKTATVMYDCRGWCSHHNTDIWADTDPQDRWMPATGQSWSHFNNVRISCWLEKVDSSIALAGAWLCYHIWESYQFNGNKGLLCRMFPLLRRSILFLVDFLIGDALGKYLVTNPSLSPENTFLDTNQTKGVLCEGSAISIQIINAVFCAYLDAACELDFGDDEFLMLEVQNCWGRLPPMLIRSALWANCRSGCKIIKKLSPGIDTPLMYRHYI